MSTRRMQGKVISFNEAKGFGWIRVKGQDNLFVHHSQIEPAQGGWKTLVDGEPVDFEIGRNGPGARRQAENLVRLNPPVPAVGVSRSFAPSLQSKQEPRVGPSNSMRDARGEEEDRGRSRGRDDHHLSFGGYDVVDDDIEDGEVH